MTSQTCKVADAFLALYDALAREPIEQVRAHVPLALTLHIDLADLIIATGEPPVDADNLQERVINLFALYQALQAADPDRDIPDKGRLEPLQRLYNLTARLNSDPADGRLVFNRVRPGRPEPVGAEPHLGDLLPSIKRITSANAAAIDLTSVRALHDLRPDGPTPAADDRRASLPKVVAAHIPFLAESADVTWTHVDPTPGIPHAVGAYAVDAVTSRLDRRVPKALAALDDTRAALALLPESALNQALLQRWQTALQARDNEDLQWLLPGTGTATPPGTSGPDTSVTPPRSANRAVVLSGDGEVVWHQDKRHGFTLETDQLSRYHLTGSLGSLGPLAEHIAHGTTLKVVDATAGRFAIAICEDEGRLIDTGHLCASAGVTHLLVPIIAPTMWEGGWQIDAARHLAEEAGITTIVVNSYAIERMSDRAHGTPKPSPTLCYAVAPHNGIVTTYSAVVTGFADPTPVTGNSEADALTAVKATV